MSILPAGFISIKREQAIGCCEIPRETLNDAGPKSASSPSRYSGDPAAAHVLEAGLGPTSGLRTPYLHSAPVFSHLDDTPPIHAKPCSRQVALQGDRIPAGADRFVDTGLLIVTNPPKRKK
jgi:hypothetical protein